MKRMLWRIAEFFLTPEGEKLGVWMDEFLTRQQNRLQPSLTVPEEKALLYIERELKRNHSPSVREVARVLGYRSSRSAFLVIQALIGKGVLRRTATSTLEVVPVTARPSSQEVV